MIRWIYADRLPNPGHFWCSDCTPSVEWKIYAGEDESVDPRFKEVRCDLCNKQFLAN